MSSETENFTAVLCPVREGGVLKLGRLCIFLRRRTNRTFAAPPIGQIYRTR